MVHESISIKSGICLLSLLCFYSLALSTRFRLLNQPPSRLKVAGVSFRSRAFSLLAVVAFAVA